MDETADERVDAEIQTPVRGVILHLFRPRPIDRGRFKPP